jgi:hypothetical protein
MKKSVVMATFVGASAGGMSAGASMLTMFGADALFNVTQDMVTAVSGFSGTPLCPTATAISFLGGGSGTGEAAMVAGNQGVAPMSRFLEGSVTRLPGGGVNVTGACQGVGTGILPGGGYDTTAATHANGLVIGMDGIAIVVNPRLADGGAGACQGAQNYASACIQGGNAFGLAFNNTITLPSGAKYTLSDWRDVLRILWMGKDHSGTANCNSEIRSYLANNYGAIYEKTFPGCVSLACAGISHLWRLDDASGTSDIFAQILGSGGTSALGGSVIPTTISSPDGRSYHYGSDNFCNTTTAVAAGGSGSSPWGSTIPGENAGAEDPAHGIVPNDSQDHDPIRRLCKGSGGSQATSGDNVCERATPAPVPATATATVSGGQITSVTVNTGGSGYLSPPNINILNAGGGSGCSLTGTVSGGAVTAITGTPCGSGFTSAPTIDLTFYGGGGAIGESTLGLLLPMVADNVIHGVTINCFCNPQGFCFDCPDPMYTSGSSRGCSQTVPVHAPLVPKAGGIGTTGANCPNGDWSGNGATCFVPADGIGDPNCLATSGGASAETDNSQQGSGEGPGTGGFNPLAADGRAYNLWAWTLGSDGVWHVASDDAGRPIYGAFYRIHEWNSTTTLGPTCQNLDMTDQIGCLVSVDSCSIGYAGREAAVRNSVSAAWINGTAPYDQCIQNVNLGGEYPLWRKLYLNTLSGFINDGGPEFALASCENDAGLINRALGHEGFVALPSTVNGGQPFCEDFNESAFCNDGGIANVNACASTGAAGLARGSDGGVFSTVCGNGKLEALEDCDFGATPGSLDNPCTTSCSSLCRCN